MEKKYQIFISSTYDDLKEERKEVVKAILRAYHFPIGMEMFSAENIEQWEQIKRTIDSSDYYILIIKKRYGTIIKMDGISYTEKEYEYAKSRKIPILGFIVSDTADIKAKDIEKNPTKLKKLEKFVTKVKNEYPCNFWQNADNLATLVMQALHKEFDKDERIGWTRGYGEEFHNRIENINKEALLSIRKKYNYEILRRANNIRLAYDFWDDIDSKILWNINKETYIEDFYRQIIIELLSDSEAKISTLTQIEFNNIKNGINYYSPNPRFMTEKQAQSFKHDEYTINNVNYIENIKSHIECTDKSRQFPYLVKNDLPLVYNNSQVVITHKTSYVINPKNFFQSYQLIFPCRIFHADVFIKNDNNQYQIKTCVFSSFNVHNQENFKKEYRKDAISTIRISKWSLPGSGYVITLEKKD